jgi:aldehyde:ferredoxin oxidoreductase
MCSSAAAPSARRWSRTGPCRCDPLGPANALVLTPGIVTEMAAPSSGRLSVGSRSSLTGGIKEANVGGLLGQKIARLGLQAIIVQGQADAAVGPYTNRSGHLAPTWILTTWMRSSR